MKSRLVFVIRTVRCKQARDSRGAREVLKILHPLEERDGDTAGVGVDVRQHVDAAVAQDAIRRRDGGPVGGLDDVLARNTLRHLICSTTLRLGLCYSNAAASLHVEHLSKGRCRAAALESSG